MRRYNRMQHRMKSHEGHNIDPKGIGSQYYGDKAKYNQNKDFAGHDQRDAQKRVIGGSARIGLGSTTTTDNTTADNTTSVSTTPNYDSMVAKLDKNKAKKIGDKGRKTKFNTSSILGDSRL